MLYLIIVIWLSTRGGGGLGYLWYKLYPFPNDVTRFKQHQKWWLEEAAKNRVAVSGEQEGGGSNKYSLKTWTIVLLWSIFLFIMAILFPKRTKDAFSNVTMPSMFKDSILDTGKSDSEKLSFYIDIYDLIQQQINTLFNQKMLKILNLLEEQMQNLEKAILI